MTNLTAIIRKNYKAIWVTIIIIGILYLAGYVFYKNTIQQTINEQFTNTLVNPDENNLFMYWIGPVPDFILYLRKLIYLHSQNQTKYKIHLINRETVMNYIDELPEFFDKLKPAHQADYVRIAAICKYGGIWLDSDTIVMNDLSSMFAKLNGDRHNTNDKYNGFFVSEADGLCNGVFGSKANTPLMQDWLSKVKNVLREKKENINWTDIGSGIINEYKNKPEYKSLITGYYIYDGSNTVYPILWSNVDELFVTDPDKIKKYEKPDQPIIILFWSSIIKYKPDIYNMTDNIFINNDTVIGYFLNKSMNTVKITFNELKKYEPSAQN